MEKENTVINNLPESGDVEIIGVKFRDAGKVYYFSPGEIKAQAGEFVIVETARGVEYGYVSEGNRFIDVSKVVPPLRTVIRKATEEDTAKYEENKRLEAEAFEICRQKIIDHKLDMKLIDAEYTFDNSKLLFYFSAEVRVDFRDLVKDLASVFRTRIELRQIGIRDEAKMLGGLGVCGQPFCCSRFLSDFVQVSIKMAKEQNLSLNSSKISGTCGRLMCCLRYEHETYEAEIAKTPPIDSSVKTSDGVGVVTEMSPLQGTIKVKLPDGTIKQYNRRDVIPVKAVSREETEENIRNGKN
ncbi:MAG: stage 0 sporulation family protein [Eubacteriales bacterium]